MQSTRPRPPRVPPGYRVLARIEVIVSHSGRQIVRTYGTLARRGALAELVRRVNAPEQEI